MDGTSPVETLIILGSDMEVGPSVMLTALAGGKLNKFQIKINIYLILMNFIINLWD